LGDNESERERTGLPEDEGLDTVQRKLTEFWGFGNEMILYQKAPP
jgi:hypothetical protein